jgi:hypothetical protein
MFEAVRQILSPPPLAGEGTRAEGIRARAVRGQGRRDEISRKKAPTEAARIMEETFCGDEEQLRRLTARRAMPITPDTELYCDLGVYGDDFAFDVVPKKQR